MLKMISTNKAAISFQEIAALLVDKNVYILCVLAIYQLESCSN